MAGNVDVAKRYLLRKGLTPAQTAGVIGGLQGESGKSLSTTARNPTSGAFGIGQWLGGRKSSLLSRPNPTSIKTQLDHLWSELQGPERAAYGRLKRAKSIDQAVDVFVRDFERPSPSEIASSIGARKQGAREVFNSIKNNRSAGGGSTVDATSGTVGATTSPPITIGGGTRTVEVPGAKGRVALAGLLQQRDPQSLLLKLGIFNPNEPTTQTVPDPGITVPGSTVPRGSSSSGSGSVSTGGRGVAKITGPNPNRIVPQVRNFMKEISSVRGGKPVVGSDGTGHSRLTVNGTVSEHTTGHASDIPARGQELINLGQAALIAAGMPRSKARQQRGGLYNVYKGKRRYQIIFNTQEGGDHTDHLHVGVKG